MLCRIFYSQGVQPVKRTLQLSHSPGQQHRDRIYSSWVCVHVCAHQSWLSGADGVQICLCAHVGASMWECSFVLMFAAFLCVHVIVCVLMNAAVVQQTNSLVLGLDLGAPVCQTIAVPVNDVWEERGADKDSFSSAHRHEPMFDAHVHTHAKTHQDCRVQVYLQSNGQTASRCFLTGRHPSSAATYYCHPRRHTAELKGSPAWRLGEDSSGFCVSLTSELTA